jgi:NAD(P)-dependent dehydrogenase (short-subunit alcohol dehydrogenase family)
MKTVLITGGNKGIGLELSRVFLDNMEYIYYDISNINEGVFIV